MKLQHVSIEVFRQLILITSRLSQEEYTQPLDILFNSSIGKHVRHIIEFYQLLFNGYKSGEVNYDNRGHDKELESVQVLALLKMRFLLVQILAADQEKDLLLTASYSADAGHQVTIPTTFSRELLYNIEHAIHHMAIIRIALEQKFPNIRVPRNFGIAYSTVRHQKVALRAS